MKKVCKTALAVLLFATLVLCLAGCVSADPDAAIRGKMIGRIYYDYLWNSDNARVDCCSQNSTDYGQIKVTYSSDSGLYGIQLKYSGVIKMGAYAIIKGEEYHTVPAYPASVGLCGIDNLTKEQVLEILEEKLALTCYFRCDEDPSQNVYFYLPGEHADGLRKWVRGHE